MPPLKDRTGQKFGRLIVESTRPGNCVCICECGNRLEVKTGNLTSGNTQSCGCLQKQRASEAGTKHGRTGTMVYRIWVGMMSRCYNKNRTSYKQYGAVGVKVCKRWHTFDNFAADMGEPPTSEHTIDRYPNQSGDYKPSNCRWATMKEQSNNRKSNVLLTKDGKTQTMTQWEEELGLCRGLIYSRLKNGWSVENALKGPKKKRGVCRPRWKKKGPIPDGFRK